MHGGRGSAGEAGTRGLEHMELDWNMAWNTQEQTPTEPHDLPLNAFDWVPQPTHPRFRTTSLDDVKKRQNLTFRLVSWSGG